MVPALFEDARYIMSRTQLTDCSAFNLLMFFWMSSFQKHLKRPLTHSEQAYFTPLLPLSQDANHVLLAIHTGFRKTECQLTFIFNVLMLICTEKFQDLPTERRLTFATSESKSQMSLRGSRSYSSWCVYYGTESRSWKILERNSECSQF